MNFVANLLVNFFANLLANLLANLVKTSQKFSQQMMKLTGLRIGLRSGLQIGVSSILFVSLSVASAAVNCPGGAAEPPPAAQSPRYSYFRQVLAKGKQASLTELLQFWAPEKHRQILPSLTLLQCQVEPWGALRTNKIGDISPECRPDVLYSWGPPEKVASLTNTLRQGQKWSGTPNPGGHSGVYATLSASATFNYGVIPIRIKLKNGVSFRSSDLDVPPGMVMYESRHHFNDFLISDARVIDSWSYGTAEHYDEVVEDILRIATNDNGQGYALRAPVGEGVKRLFSLTITERSLADEESLKKVLLQMLQLVVNDQGRIVYQLGACESPTSHFLKRY